MSRAASALTLPACFFVSMGCGTLYVYSAYAPQLSAKLGLSATQMSNIGMTGSLTMALSGPLAGVLVDRYGFTLPVVISFLCTIIGYTIIRVAYTNVISSQLLLTFALFLIGNGATFAFSASVKSSALNYPHQRGIATSVVLAGYGLSAFVISFMANILVPGSTPGFLSLITFLPSSFFVLFGPIVAFSQHDRTALATHHDSEDPPIELAQMGDEHARPRSIDHHAAHVNDITGTEMLRLPLFWYYSIVLGFLAGMGQTYIYTCGYMVKALAVDEDVHLWQTRQVAVISLANFAGRILSGALSDAAKIRFKVSRTWVLVLATALCFVSQVYARVLTTVEWMTFLSIITGVFYGVGWGVYPGVLSDAFGLKYFSANWGFVALSPIPVAYLLTLRMGLLYDRNSKDGVCSGPHCFQSNFVLTAIFSALLFGVIFAALRFERTLHNNTRPVY